jgi:hypothetical protein
MTKPFLDKFPKIAYITSPANSRQVPTIEVLTNILARVTLLKGIKNNALFYYTYQIKDSDTPEIIASKLYGESARHWIILMINDIINPLYDWPLPYNEFIKFVSSKYDSLANAMSGIHHYQLTISNYDSRSRNTSNSVYQIDSGVYANTPELEVISTNLQDGTTATTTKTTQTVTNYDYEQGINESKRTIKLIKPDLVGQIESELSRLLAVTVLN